jgi:hypothetical protein
VVDLAGKPGEWLGQKHYTLDTLAPSLLSTAPLDNSTSVAINSRINITFNETINAGQGKITLKNLSDATLDQVFDIKDHHLSFHDKVLTLTPTAVLDSSTNYAVLITPAAIIDNTGNAYAGIADTSILNFKTMAPLQPTDEVLVGKWLFEKRNGFCGCEWGWYSKC